MLRAYLLKLILKHRSIVLVAGCLLLVSALPASPQDAPRGPAGGLFGATRSEVAGRDRLTFTFQTAEGFDSELPAEFRSQTPQDVQADGWSTLFAASSGYARRGANFSISASASSTVRYYQEIDRLDTLGQAAGLGFGIRLPMRGNFRIESTAAYSPSYLYQLFPVGTPPILGASIPTDPDYRIAQIQSYAYRTAAGLSFGSRLGTMVTASGEFNRTDFGQPSTRSDLEFYDTGLTVGHAWGRSGGVSTGYHYRAGQFGLDAFTREHRVTLGFDYSTALSRSRRATVRLNLTPSRLDLPAGSLRRIAGTESSGHLYRINGDVSISYPFRLHWSADTTYRRELEYLAILGEPVFSDGARVAVAGLISRRIDVSALAGYAKGGSALVSGREGLETYTGAVKLRYALKRWSALYTEYLYYHYDLGEQAFLAPDLPTVFDQHGVRVGFILFLEPLGK